MNIRPEEIRKIVIVQTAFIGDVILTTPLIRVTAESFPGAEIHFITIPASRNTVETLPYISKLWIYDKRGEDAGPGKLFRFSGLLKQEKIDLALVPHRSLRSALLVYFAGIPKRIGFDRSSGSFLFTDKVKYPVQGHEIERNLKLLDNINIRPLSKELPEVFPDRADENEVSKWLESHSLVKDQPLICLAPGSIWFTKRWIPGYWARLADRLREKKFEVVFIGSSNDKPLIDDIIAELNCEVHNSAGLFTIRQSAELIRRSRLLISNDSAPTHIGVAVKTPVLTIYGSTVPEFGFFPYGDGDRFTGVEGLSCRPCTDHGRYRCPLKHFKCMHDLGPDRIFTMVLDMIHETG